MLTNPHLAELKAALADRAAGKDVSLALIQRLQDRSDRWERIDAQAADARNRHEATRRANIEQGKARDAERYQRKLANKARDEIMLGYRRALQDSKKATDPATPALMDAVKLAVHIDADVLEDYLDPDFIELLLSTEDIERPSTEQLEALSNFIHAPWSERARRELVFKPDALSRDDGEVYELHATIRDTLLHALRNRDLARTLARFNLSKKDWTSEPMIYVEDRPDRLPAVDIDAFIQREHEKAREFEEERQRASTVKAELDAKAHEAAQAADPQKEPKPSILGQVILAVLLTIALYYVVPAAKAFLKAL